MKAIQRHVTRCIIAGMVALLPIGGTIAALLYLESQLKPAVKELKFYFPGLALILVVVAFYVLGLVVSTLLGRWFLRVVDWIMSRLPGLGTVYETFKQILGYGSGEQALFKKVVLVQSISGNGAELGLVTGDVRSGTIDSEASHITVFVPGAPNPAAGRMLLVETSRCQQIDLTPDQVFKGLFSVGATLCEGEYAS